MGSGMFLGIFACFTSEPYILGYMALLYMLWILFEAVSTHPARESEISFREIAVRTLHAFLLLLKLHPPPGPWGWMDSGMKMILIKSASVRLDLIRMHFR